MCKCVVCGVFRSVVEVWRYMSRFTGYKLLLGDLNAEPDSSPIRCVHPSLDSIFRLSSIVVCVCL